MSKANTLLSGWTYTRRPLTRPGFLISLLRLCITMAQSQPTCVHSINSLKIKQSRPVKSVLSMRLVPAANTSNANNQTRVVLFKRVQGQPPTLTRQSPAVRVSLPEIFWVSGKDTFTYLTMGIISSPTSSACFLVSLQLQQLDCYRQ